MSMRSELKDELKRVLFDRAHPVLHELGIRKLSRDRSWTKEYREARIDKLLDLSEKILLHTEKNKFNQHIEPAKWRSISGPKDTRGDSIYAWVKKKWPRDSILYSFWKGSTCVYVGVGENYVRIGQYKKSKYLDKSEANWIKVWSVNGKSYLHLVECLAIHLFKPKDNLKKAKRPKYSKACPICRKLNRIRKTLRLLLS